MGSVSLVLNMTSNERSTLKILFGVLFVNLLSFSILIPLYGEIGAILSFSMSYVLINDIAAIKIKQC
jgi:O-antigen/teichoic acid export membrane protein